MPSKSRAVHVQDSGSSDRQLSSLVFGDLGSSGRESGRLLAGVAALSFVGPWVIFGDEVVSESLLEITIASVVFAAHSAFAFGLLVWALLRRSDTPHQLDYWVITGSVTVSMVATTLLTLHLDHFDSLLVLNARTILRLVTLHFAGVVVGSLRPKKAWLLSAVIITPLILAHPIAATTLLSSWDAKQGPDGWLQYSCTLTVVFAIISTSLLSSYAGEAAHRASQALLTQLDAQAARSQGLLETAMPSYVARALLSRVPDAELTVSCESATVAFIALSRFDELSARMHPRELMQWLHAVYEALDSLVAAYEGTVVKVETVSNVYLVTSGLPWQSLDGDNHARTLSLFALDALLTIEAVPCAAMRLPLTARVGLHSGPLTAGLIGRTRRYYRIFGDTVNVASRMMSTGEAGRVQASESTIRLILGLTATSPLPFRVPGDSAMSLVNRFGMYDFVHVRLRGETFVKGKGLLPTFWLEAKDAQHRTQTRTHTRSGAGSGVIPASARPGSLYYDRVSRDLKGRTETSAAGTVSAGAGGSGGRRTVSTGKPLGSTPRDVPARLPVVVSPRPDPRMMSSARASSRRALMGLPSVPRMPLDELVSASATDGPLPRASSSIPMHRSPMFVDPLRGAHRTLPGAVSIAEGGAATGIARYAVSSPGSTGALAIEPESDEARPGIEVEPHVGVMDTELSTVGEVVEVSPQRGDLMTNRGWMVAEQAAPALQTYAATVVAPSPIDEETARSDLLRDEPHDGGSVVGSGSYVHASSAAFLHAASTAVIVGDNAACEEPESDWQVWFRGTVLADILDVMRSGTWREALLLRFENHETEKRAARELFVHSLKGTTSALCVWLVCFITVLLLSSFLPGLGINHTAFSNALILPLAFTAVFGGASVAVQLFWLGDLSHAARRMLNRGMLVGSVVFVAALVWFCVGPGPSILLPRASAAFAGVSSDSGASPFEGQILLSLMIVAFLQCTAHMRLRVAHVALIGAICVALTLGFAASSITRSSGWPDNVVGLGVWAIFIAVSSNALTATMAAFAWEARCRTQVLMAAAARAAESEATELLKNLLPPTVVADNKAGRLTKPVLAHDVVILHGDIVGFTALASRIEPLQLMSHLNTIYSAFDDVVEKSGLWKLETVGDAYIVAGGLFDSASSSTQDHPSGVPPVVSREAALSIRVKLDTAFKVAMSMLDVLRDFRDRTGLDLHMRVGIHIGTVAHGVIGTSTPRFCILGEATSVAELTQSQGAPDTITCSAAARDAYLASAYSFMPMASVAARSPGGAGGEIETFAVKFAETSPRSPVGSMPPGALSPGGVSALVGSVVSLSSIPEHRVPSA